MKTMTKIDHDIVEVAQENYKVLLENRDVRVLDYRSRPGERTAMHLHPGCLIYSFTPSQIRTTIPYGNQMDLSAGEVIWLKAESYAAENVGATDAHLLIVEMKRPGMPEEASFNQANGIR
jgi:hypothetical protein